MTHKFEVGDIVVFDKMPDKFSFDSPVFGEVRVFGIPQRSWLEMIGYKFVIKELRQYRGQPGFVPEAYPDASLRGTVLPLTGARFVSRAYTAPVVSAPRKDSEYMKSTPRMITIHVPMNKFVSNRVLEVEKDSPAEKGGLKVGDVITRIGKYDVGPYTKISDILEKLGPDRKITVKVIRNGKSKYCHVTLGRDARTGKAVLGITNNPKNVKVAMDTSKMTLEEHYRRIAESNKKALETALEASLAKTKADAQPLKAKHDAAVDEALAAEDDNHFLKQAREEMEAVQALLADMKGADALFQARALRAKLRAKNLSDMERTTASVNAYLNKMADERRRETEIAPITVKRFSWKRAVAAATVLGTAIACSAYAYLSFFTA